MIRAKRYIFIIVALLVGVVMLVTTTASPPVATQEVTDFGRNRWRTHYSPSEPEYPRANNARPVWEVPLGLSRSQPLVIRRDFDGNGTEDTHVFHIAGDKLWALRGDMLPPERRPAQSVEDYRAQLQREGFIRWSTPAEALCASPDLLARDELLASKCRRVGQREEKRPFASSQAAYVKGARPSNDLIYVGFGHPAAVVAIRALDGKVMGGYIIDPDGDRGIVGAPLVFDGDTVVIGTTSGDAFIIRGMASGVTSHRRYYIGGRISFSPVPLGEGGFLLATDARSAPGLGTHGYMMAYSLPVGGAREFDPKWPAAVVTPAGIPGEAAVDGTSVYFADKFGKLYALRLDTGEMLWCRQYPDMGSCRSGGNPTPAFINSGPGIDENNVYFVFRNNKGPNVGAGHVVALDKRTGGLVWERTMEAKGNTAPVPVGYA